MDLSVLGMSVCEVNRLALDAAIDLDNFARGKIGESQLQTVEQMKQWFLAAAEIYGSRENFYSGYFDPKTAIALDGLLAGVLKLPKCEQLSELGGRIGEVLKFFVYRSADEISRLKYFCLEVSNKFLNIHLQYDWRGPCYLVA